MAPLLRYFSYAETLQELGPATRRAAYPGCFAAGLNQPMTARYIASSTSANAMACATTRAVIH